MVMEKPMGRCPKAVFGIYTVVLWMGMVVGAGIWAQVPRVADEAYGWNREGMIAMSQARFEDAIRHFLRAAELAGDYQVQGRPLVYTPVFMAAWAYEKIVKRAGACREYRRFLKVALSEKMEPTKAEHARDYLAQYC